MGVRYAEVVAEQQHRAAQITRIQQRIDNALLNEQSEILILYGDIEVSRTGIGFYTKNLSEYSYGGSSWVVARYVNGELRAIPYSRRRSIFTTSFSGSTHIPSGRVGYSHAIWRWEQGELPAGHYMLIHSRSQSSRTGIQDYPPAREFLFIKFEITEETPQFLPPRNLWADEIAHY